MDVWSLCERESEKREERFSLFERDLRIQTASWRIDYTGVKLPVTAPKRQLQKCHAFFVQISACHQFIRHQKNKNQRIKRRILRE